MGSDDLGISLAKGDMIEMVPDMVKVFAVLLLYYMNNVLIYVK